MAFGSFEQGDSSPMAEINVTPFVDIMLVLLIVFMITMPVITHTIPLQLPVSSENTVPEFTEPVRLSINVDGKYYLNEELVNLVDLENQLRAIQSRHANTVLAVSADKNVAYEKVVDALSSAQAAGVSKIGFVTETKQH